MSEQQPDLDNVNAHTRALYKLLGQHAELLDESADPYAVLAAIISCGLLAKAQTPAAHRDRVLLMVGELMQRFSNAEAFLSASADA